jgi:hypothetical protein
MRNYRTKKQNLKQKGGAAAAAQNYVNYEILGSYDKLKSHYKDEMQITNKQVPTVNSFLISDKFSEDDFKVLMLTAYKSNFYNYCNMYLWSLSAGMNINLIIN